MAASPREGRKARRGTRGGRGARAAGREGPAAPEGFERLRRGGPFLHLFGPLYARDVGGFPVIGMRIGRKHLNLRGIAHGGLLVTLADSALGIALSTSKEPPRPMVTVSLSVDFADAARLGDWVEARVDIQKNGARLAFASCHLVVGGRRILRASGVFAVMPPARPREGFEG